MHADKRSMSTLPSIPAAPSSFSGYYPGLPEELSPARVRNMQQGRALEVLGHATKYLIDSRFCDPTAPSVDTFAVRLLMICSRAVFEDRAAIHPRNAC
jgi:hypothetical protein